MRPYAQALVDQLSSVTTAVYTGRVIGLKGLLIEASGPAPALRLGAQVDIATDEVIRGEIIGFRDDRALILPYDPVSALRAGAVVRFGEEGVEVRPSEAWLGRIVDAFGCPIDRAGPLKQGPAPKSVKAAPPPAHSRARLGPRLDLGVKALNTFAAARIGQRLGVFAGSGVGKSVLLSMLARYASADVAVIGLIGERGREVNEFIEDTLGPAGLARAVVVVATSDEPAARRRLAAETTLAIAESFRDQGRHVLLLMDSVTRYAMAGREIGLALGEPPATKGYTPSVFADLPRLLERSGPGVVNSAGVAGAITAFFTVLVDGDDHNEPIADAVRGILDGHIVMERRIAEQGRFPAINVLKSVSRTMPGCLTAEEYALVAEARKLLAAYADMEELIRIGAYKAGADAEIDRAIRLRPALEAFLAQQMLERVTSADCFQYLAEVLRS